MEAISWLQTLAEVAIAVAGFSAVVTAFNRDSARMAPIMADRLFTIVSISLVVALFAIVPGILQGFGLGPSEAFRVAGLASLVVQLLLFTAIVRAYRSIEGSADQVWPTGVLLAYGFMILSVLASAASVVGRPAGREAACYLLSQTSMLTVAGTRLAGLTVVMVASSGGVAAASRREARGPERPSDWKAFRFQRLGFAPGVC